LTGCSETSTKSPDLVDGIRKLLDQARLTDVSVSQDRDKGVVTLGGHVAADADKAQAAGIEKRPATPAMIRVNAILDDAKAVTATVKEKTEHIDNAVHTTRDRINQTADRVVTSSRLWRSAGDGQTIARARGTNLRPTSVPMPPFD
jgi:hypothetical protein